MSADELLATDDHLAWCDDCRTCLGDAVGWRPSSFDLPRQADPVEHLTFEQLSAYVDKSLGEAARGDVERHVFNCTRCDAELEDLQQLVAELEDPYRVVEASPIEKTSRVVRA